MKYIFNFLGWLGYMTDPPSPKGTSAALYINGEKVVSSEGNQIERRKVSGCR